MHRDTTHTKAWLKYESGFFFTLTRLAPANSLMNPLASLAFLSVPQRTQAKDRQNGINAAFSSVIRTTKADTI